MPRDQPDKPVFPDSQNTGSPPRSARAIAPLLAKLAKHLALLATALIIGGANGKSLAAQISIFLVVVLAALFYSLSQTVQRRASGPCSPRVSS